tara:strand:- start:1228 stop:1350 length:123 start_codon:yes stop_codon:yes gene_type:complete
MAFSQARRLGFLGNQSVEPLTDAINADALFGGPPVLVKFP